MFNARVLESVSALPREAWDRLSAQRAEGWDYFRLCESAAPQGFQLGAVAAFSGDTPIAVAPTFSVSHRIDMAMPTSLQALGGWLDTHVPGLVNAKVVGVGSPLIDECPIAIDPRLNTRQRDAAFATMLHAIAEHGKAVGSDVLAFKDMTESDRDWAGPLMAQAGYAAAAALPIATLHLPFADEKAYIASLSGPMRNEIRRKLKKLSNIQVEFPRTIDGIDDEIEALFSETRLRRKADYADFDNVPPRYFRTVLEGLGPRSRMMVCRIDGVLASFNLFLVEKDRIIGKYLGLRYPLAREHNLYFLNWMLVARICMAEGKPWLQSGQTSYCVKVRLGSKLKRSWVYFRHVNPVINVAFRALGPRFGFDAMDPDLRKLGSDAPYLTAA